jgi:dipeptidyl aminopeptidase/acylaminoacyl peptidase
VRRLTARPGFEGLAAWSPGGGRIAYVATGAGGEPEVWLVDPDGRRPRRLARGGTLPAWSPDGRRIAWVAPATGALEVASSGGGPARRLGGLRASAGPSGPSWSPDGRRMAVVDQAGRLVVIDARTGRARPLTAGTGAYPAWSPDGRHVAVLLDPHALLVVVSARGPGRRPLARTDGLGAPSWSPDGRFVAYSDAAHHLAVAGLAGWGPRRLTHDAANDEDPAWRP